MGRHNMEVMTGPEPLAVFERYVRVKRELLTLVEESLVQDDAMLAMMQSPAA